MLNFNHRPKLSEEISTLIDKALTKENEHQTPRDYLGASRLGVSCNRALQFEYTKTAKDEGQNFTGKILASVEGSEQRQERNSQQSYLHQIGVVHLFRFSH